MRLTIFGSTGDAGRLVIDKALAAGHEIVAYARNPDKLDIDHPRLSVIAGELDDDEAIERAVHGSNAVISLLGPRPRPRFKGTPITAGTRRIIAAMTRHGVLRLIATATPSVVGPDDRFSLRFYMGKTFVHFILPHVYRDIVGTAEAIRSSDLDWTLVRVPMLTAKESASPPVAGRVGDPGIKMFLSRSTLADFLLAQLEAGTWMRRAPVLSNGR